MIISAIVTEFNPFHPGHKYIAEKAKEITGADLVIALMSGNFVQRGEPAVFDMGVRARAALENSYDMVFELPPHSSLSSAEGFASGAVKILDKLGIDCLVFGSESGDLDALTRVSSLLVDESELYREALQESLKRGLSFPSAREHAILSCIPQSEGLDKEELHNILQNPNNILGLEYLKALEKSSSSITPFTVKRINSSYHGKEKGVSFDPAFYCYSAEKIRKQLNDCCEETGLIPDDPALEYIDTAVNTYGTVYTDSLTPLLLYNLLSDDLEESLDKTAVPSDLSKRIIKNRNFTGTFSEFCALLKTKNITYTACSRHLLHLILNMDYREFSGDYDYVRLLGFNRIAEQYLGEINKRSRLKILSNSSDIHNYMDERSTSEPGGNAFSALETHLRIDSFYNILRDGKKRREHPLPPEISRRIIIWSP